ncbi:hypothetical protein Bp8pS_041 [Bacillus phage vB_BpuM-BpSp]|nr:hypothetical protein Bp8pS_041 [Bacillus phage vB_BpuM-BpSp]
MEFLNIFIILTIAFPIAILINMNINRKLRVYERYYLFFIIFTLLFLFFPTLWINVLFNESTYYQLILIAMIFCSIFVFDGIIKQMNYDFKNNKKKFEKKYKTYFAKMIMVATVTVFGIVLVFASIVIIFIKNC